MQQTASANVCALYFGLFAALGSVACGQASARLERPGPALAVQNPTLFPETIEYDPTRAQFLLGSFREGAIYAVDGDGRVSRLVDDPRLCSVLGIAVDAARSRLWAVNADLGACSKPSAAGPKRLAAVALFDLETGEARGYFDLAPLVPGPHLPNGIALDDAGNAYVSDSFAPALYKINARGRASVLLQDPSFAGAGINLNGLAVHPDGYLLVIKKSDGRLFKVPLAQPHEFSEVRIDRPLVGGDGLLLIGGRSAVIVANRTPDQTTNAAFTLSSNDDWASARVVAEQPLGDDYATTAVVRDGELFAVSSKLNQLIQASPQARARMRVPARIRRIGRLENAW
jgi:sugar lactone lactonase YvrE